MQSPLYSKHAQQYDTAVTDNVYNAKFERPTLQSMIGELEGKDVLDLGCGSGVYVDFFIAKGANKITCVDYSSAMVDIVKQKYAQRVEAYVQDAAQGLPNVNSNSIDLIVSPLMLHYIEDLTPLFTDIARVLKPEGQFVFSTHHPFGDFECSQTGNYFERELLHDEWNTIGEPVKVSFYRRSLTELTQGLMEHGLVISQISEGQVGEDVKAIDPDAYAFLSTKPNFIFIKSQKL
ncbi:SAM-dependent methyltransferase [Photobacterium jeanii]|uniref:SAM-dependent methyltransferase n=1 Tax=Photobacterium jeanii TaxID=858640 RepID=A0A178KLG3_9GAMM|nr:class I SAM-dependent methyltransferase [Photobacterium jeanii]OAN17966.1 SAM-dependent methyltransferase [Photobacterium jeanii]PST92364.1 methyltransferase domain-containing protein [Photobacterium jeanii]